MAKRKAGVNNIIYELDNDDIELSSDDEVMEAKVRRSDNVTIKKDRENTVHDKGNGTEVINLDSSSDNICDTFSPNYEQIGGKTLSDTLQTNQSTENFSEDLINVNKSPKNNNTTYNEDIIVDSPASNSDLGVVGCENRTPLVTVRFKDSKLAYLYKERIKKFLITLLKSHSDNKVSLSESSDVEVDIWPEDLIEEEFDRVSDVEDNLFFVDTAPCDEDRTDVPKYSQTSSIISNIIEKDESPVATSRRGPSCFNCDGIHQLKDCPLPRNNSRIAAKRKAMPPRVGRYHIEDEQKYGHLIPGRISGNLRHALGLKRNELPLHIYRMRLLGYPPGWLEEARISHSGITLFDSSGNAIQDPEEEDGELYEPGSKDKFDIKKILDYPGFNVPASSRYIEEAHIFGLPPMSVQDSKIGMLQTLAPNAMKAYKRKKLTFFPSAGQTSSQEGQAEMELDSGDEIAEFPSIPPLPDEEPAPPPPPPPTPPLDEKSEKTDKSDLPHTKTSNDHKNLLKDTNTHIDSEDNNIHSDNKNNILKNNQDFIEDEVNLATTTDDELEVIEVVQVTDIPVPEDDLIIIDDDGDDKSQLSSRSSPSLDVLEERKISLLAALKGGDVAIEAEVLDESLTDITEPIKNKKEDDAVTIHSSEENFEVNKVDHEKSLIIQDESINIDDDDKNSTSGKIKTSEALIDNNDVKVSKESQKSNIEIDNKCLTSKGDNVQTPESRTGHVKVTSYGTPVLNVASPYVKLPSDDKFSKNICDVINFENLPNSTGKFKKIRNLLKKVKTAVDKIQDS